MSPRTDSPAAASSPAPVAVASSLPWLADFDHAAHRLRAFLSVSRVLALRSVLGRRLAVEVLTHEVACAEGADLADVRTVVGELVLEDALIEKRRSFYHGAVDDERLERFDAIATTRSPARAVAQTIEAFVCHGPLEIDVAFTELYGRCEVLAHMLPSLDEGDLLEAIALATATIDEGVLAAINRTHSFTEV